jgi:HAMP domain-containing protein
VSRTRRSIPPQQPPQRSNAEQEAHGAAERLNTQIETALAAMPVRAPEAADELEAYADRIERTARDLSVALRELARQRRADTRDEG